MNATHTRDSQCTVSPATNACIECGVQHGDPCPDCGGTGFHDDDCGDLAEERNESVERATLITVSAKVNAITSRIPGMPHVSPESCIEQLTAWLMWNDRNGCYSTVDRDLEGFDHMTIAEAWQHIIQMTEEN